MSLCKRSDGIMVCRRVALIGIGAILLQALLLGWHHHAIALVRGSSPIASFHHSAQPLAPAATERSCEICTILHQQSAAPVAFIIPPTPFATATINDLGTPLFHDGTSTRGFNARGPPAIERMT